MNNFLPPIIWPDTYGERFPSSERGRAGRIPSRVAAEEGGREGGRPSGRSRLLSPFGDAVGESERERESERGALLLTAEELPTALRFRLPSPVGAHSLH